MADEPDYLRMSPEELAKLSGAPAAAPPAAAPAAPQAEPDYLRMAPEELAKTQAAATGGGFNQRVGSLATAFNDRLLWNVLGSPFDATAYLLNKGHDLLAAPKLSDQVTREAGGTPKPWVDPNPTLGSEWWKRQAAATIGRTEPKDALDNLLAGIGGGAADAALMFATGGALNAAGRAPRLAKVLMGGGPDALSLASNVAAGAGSGAGGELGDSAMAALSDNDPTWRSLGRTIGGFGGGFAGAVAPATVVNLGQGFRSALRPFSEQGKQLLAGRALNEAAGSEAGESTAWAVRSGNLSDPNQPLGISPTLGQATNDPGIMNLERGTQQFSPAASGQFARLASENNQTVRGALDRLGDPAGATPGDISAVAMPGMEAQRVAAKEAERAAWRAVDPNNEVQIPMQPIRKRLQDYIGGMTMATRRLVPDDLVQMFQKQIGPGSDLPLREVQDLRSDLLGRERAARAARDDLQANVYRNIDEAVFPGLDPAGGVDLPPGMSQEVRDRHAAARAQTRQYHAEYDQPPIRDIVGPGKTPDSAAFERIFTSAPGQRERVSQFVSAARGDPELLQAGRNWFTARLGERISSAMAQDTAGDQKVLGAGLVRFVNQNRALINSELFTSDQRRVVNEMVDAVQTLGRTANAGKDFGGSSTAANLATDNYVKALVGNWLRPALGGVGAVVGGAGGGAFGLIPAIAGAATGGGTGAAVANALYSKSGEQVKALLAQALTDPAFATELMGRANKATIQFASPRLQSMLSTVPLTVETGGR